MRVYSVKGSTFAVMERDTLQAKLYEHYLGFILPEGILDFFELVWMETMSLTAREAKKEVAYTGILHIHLDERDNHRTDHSVGLSHPRPQGGVAHPQATVAGSGREERHPEHLSSGRGGDPVLCRVCRVLEKKTWIRPR